MAGGGPGGWPSGWNVYYVVALAAAMALLLPLVLWVVSRLLSEAGNGETPRHGANGFRDGRPESYLGSYPGSYPGSYKDSLGETALIPSENPAQSGRKSNPRVFQALSAAFILILLALLMIPCAVTLPQSMLGLVCILSLASIAGLALLYGVRKQDLDWLRSWSSGGEE